MNSNEMIEAVVNGSDAYDVINEQEIKPKKLASFYVKAIKKMKPKPAGVTVRKSESTLPRGWDYGVYVVLDVKLNDKHETGVAINLRVAEEDPKEVSGTVQLDANYGGIVATKRGSDPMSVAKMLIDDTVRHLSNVV